MTEVPPAPSRVRYAVVSVTCLASVLLYLDRVCFGFAEVYVREGLRISTLDMSWVLGAFFFSYALAQVPSGWLSDRFGARPMLTIYILAWSAFTAATGLATGLLTLLAARLAFGIAQAGAYPTAAGLVGRWVPLRGRGLANSIIALGGRAGGAVAALLTMFLLVAFTPASTPARLADDDLLSPPLLCQQLQCGQEPSTYPIARRFRERLPESSAEAFQSLAALAPDDSSDPALRAALLEGLNHVLTQPSIDAGLDIGGLKLSEETSRLLRVPVASRTPGDTERLNRLLLEAACPGSVRQLYGLSWRSVLLTYGGAGVLVALAFWLIVRDRPRDHPRVNEAEARLAEDGSPPAKPATGIPFLLLVRSQNMWLSGLMQFGINLGWVFLITLLPRYLSEAHGVPIEQRAVMTSVPLFAAWAGMFSGGLLTDFLTARLGRRWGRALPIGVTQVTCCLVLLACPWLPGAWFVVAALSVMAVCVDLGVPAIWAFAQDVGGRNVGATVGWGNMWGNLGAAVSPILLTQIQTAAGWPSAFVTCTVAFLVAGLAGLCLDATRPLSPPAEAPGQP